MHVLIFAPIGRDAALTQDLSAQLDLERNLQREAGSHPNYREGVQAFLQKL